MKKIIILGGTTAGIVVAVVAMSFIVSMAGGRPTFSHSKVAARIELSKATTNGKTVADILHEMGVTNRSWRIRDGEWWGFEGKAFVSCVLNDGSVEFFAWQWDAAWPYALAITPKTAKAFPLMDPHVDLTPYGQSSLWCGKGGLDKYFKRK
jgi:hypothetical protein